MLLNINIFVNNKNDNVNYEALLIKKTKKQKNSRRSVNIKSLLRETNNYKFFYKRIKLRRLCEKIARKKRLKIIRNHSI